MISISGLSFLCPSCELRNESPCEVFLADERALLSCDSAAEALLGKIAPSAYDEQHPLPSELRSFLLGARVSEKSAESALRLLLHSTIGKQALMHEAYIFAAKYPQVLATLFRQGEGTTDVRLAFWRVPDSEGIRLDASLRASIVLQEQTLTANDLFEDLSVSNIEQDRIDLKVYEDTLREGRADLADIVQSARIRLEDCAHLPIDERENNQCLPASLKALSEPVQKYLQRVQVQQLIQSAKDKKKSSIENLSGLLRVNYQDFRTPETHNIVFAALQSVQKSQPSDRQAVLSEKYQTLLDFFAQNDKEIQVSLNALLLENAQTAWAAGELETCFQNLKRSILLSAESSPGREQLVQEIENSEIWSKDPGWRTRFPEISSSLGNRTSPKRFTLQEFLAWIALCFGIIGLCLLFSYAFRERRLALEEAEYEAELLQAREETELLELFEFFELSEGDGIPELTKKYRQKAKEVHPDRDGGETSIFQDLQEKYLRTQELLLRYAPSAEHEEEGEAIEEEGMNE